MVKEIFDLFTTVRFHAVFKFAIVMSIFVGAAMLPFDRHAGGFISAALASGFSAID